MRIEPIRGACGAALVALLYGGTTDFPRDDSWFRVGDVLREVVRKARADRGKDPSRVDSGEPLLPTPVRADAVPPGDHANEP